MEQSRLEEYAKLIVKMGIRPQKGQEVMIVAGLDQIEFVRMTAEMCYQEGASKVQVDWQDMPLNKLAQIYQSEEKLSSMQLESEKNTALDKALTHISATRKTEKQIRDFLAKKGFLPAVVDYVVEKMRGYDFLNDGEYATEYISHAATKKGARLIKCELRAKGVSERDVDVALESLDGETELAAATGILEKYLRSKTVDRETLQKAYRYLLGKGFDYDTAKRAIGAFGDEED